MTFDDLEWPFKVISTIGLQQEIYTATDELKHYNYAKKYSPASDALYNLQGLENDTVNIRAFLMRSDAQNVQW